jgi:hypothetical protein
MAETASKDYPPKVEFLVNSQGGKSLRCLNYQFNAKTIGKMAACYTCSTARCYASISLRTRNVEGSDAPIVVDPFEVIYFNFNHREGCEPKKDYYFNAKSFIYEVKEHIKLNPSSQMQESYEAVRSKKEYVSTHLPDYAQIEDRLVRFKAACRIITK